MRFVQISAAVARIAAVITAVRGFIGTEMVNIAFGLHLCQARLSAGMLSYSSSDPRRLGKPAYWKDHELKRNVESVANQLGRGPWQQTLLPALCPAAGLGSASC